MKATPDTKTVHDLLAWKKAQMLRANPEYQRGEAWNTSQKKRLVDSVLRGYPIPLIYLHHIKTAVAGAMRDDFEIIDGQQRLIALSEFREGHFKPFDPVQDAEEARFPSFIEKQPCPWGGKTFDELTPELQQQFFKTSLSIVMIETEEANEARDLFIRLQEGMPLTSQEKRDAWPGNFTDFVLKVGGKDGKYPGKDFFRVVMKAKPRNRGEFRQLVAQMMMLFLAHRETGGEKLCEVNKDAIDKFYYRHLEFDHQSADAKRFNQILELLNMLLSDGKRPKVIGHEAIHLVLLADGLLDEYTRAWTAGFAAAFDKFRAELAAAKKTRWDALPDQFWLKYGQLTRANSDRADTILRRHQFFLEKMHGWLKPQLKDPTRIYGALERELIYYRDKKLCQVCALAGTGHEVAWSEHEIHHVDQHSKGGWTTIENGALVHKDCHPKGDKATLAFAEKWKANGDAVA